MATTQQPSETSGERPKAKPRQSIRIPIDVFQQMRDALQAGLSLAQVAAALTAEHASNVVAEDMVKDQRRIRSAMDAVASWQDERMLGTDTGQTTLQM